MFLQYFVRKRNFNRISENEYVNRTCMTGDRCFKFFLLKDGIQQQEDTILVRQYLYIQDIE